MSERQRLGARSWGLEKMSTLTPNLQSLIPAVIVLVAFSLRIYGLEIQSMWADEGTSVALAPRSLAQIARDASHDIHPPLYYFTLHYWIKVAGTDVFAVRALSAFYGTLLVAVSYLLGRRWFGTRAAVVAGVAAAVSPFAIHYSQETRMYILVTLFGALSWWAFARWRASQERNAYWIVVYWVLALATIYTHYFGVAIVVAQNLVWLLHKTKDARRKTKDAKRSRIANRWVAAQLSLVAAYLPWLYYSRQTLLNWPATSGTFGPLFLLQETLRIFSLGPSVPAEWSPWLWGVLALILIAVTCYVLRITYYGAYTLAWLSTPLALILLLSIDRPFYDPKFLLPALPAFHLLLGAGVAALGRWLRFPWTTAFLAIAFVGAAAYQPLVNEWTNPQYWRDDYRGIVRTIQATSDEDDAVVLLGPGQIEILNYYYDGNLARYPMPEQRPIDPEVTRTNLRQIKAAHDRVYAVLWAQEESDPKGIIEGWLDENAFKASDRWYGDVRLAVYEFGDLSDELAPVEARFGEHVTLVRAAVAPEAVRAGDILRVALEWQTETPMDRRLTAFVQLLDAGNHIVGQRDGPPAATPTTDWSVNEPQRGRLGVPVLPGTPPGTYRLIAGLYDSETGRRLTQPDGSDSIQLAEITVTQPPVPPAVESLDLSVHRRIDLGDVALLGWRVNKLGFDHAPETPLRPGDPLSVVLFWEAETASPAVPASTLRLRGPDGAVVAEWEWVPAEERYPPERWDAGEVVRDPQVRFVPGGLAAGDYHLTLVAGDRTLSLGTLSTQAE